MTDKSAYVPCKHEAMHCKCQPSQRALDAVRRRIEDVLLHRQHLASARAKAARLRRELTAVERDIASHKTALAELTGHARNGDDEPADIAPYERGQE